MVRDDDRGTLSEEPTPRSEPTAAPDGPARFRLALFNQTPRTWVTPLLAAINVLVFVVMIAAGVGILAPSVDSLIAWGANYAPRTTQGQWWRLLTSAFIHIGVFHVTMNLIGLWQIGFLVERLLGNRAFLIVYLFSGLCGSIASVAWNPFAVSAGASGAVFGVYGALFAFLIHHRGSIPREVLQPLQKSAVFFVVLNVVYGLQLKGIDMGAHIGGLVGGFGAALIVARPLGAARTPGSARRQIILAALGVGVVLGAWALLPRAVDIQGLMTDFQAVERTAIDAYNGALGRRREDQVSDDDLARIIDQQVLPPWHKLVGRFRAIGRLPRDQKKRIDDLVRYMELRERAWRTMSEALQTKDQTKAQEAGALQREAEALLKEPTDVK